MTELREIRDSDFDEVHRSLLVRLDRAKPPEVWRRLFNYPWRPSWAPRGYVLVEGDRFVGFLGLVFAPDDRAVGRSPVCNLSSWIVLESYRGQSMRLLSPVLGRADWTVTNLTPTAEVGELMQRLGFVPLETHRSLLRLRSGDLVRGSSGSRIREVGGASEGPMPEDWKTIVDHHGGIARALVVHAGAGEALVMYTVGRLRGIPVARIHHVTDAAPVIEALSSLRRHFLLRRGACIMEFDRRILPEVPEAGLHSRRITTPRLFRSPDRTPSELSELYSERILLEL